MRPIFPHWIAIVNAYLIEQYRQLHLKKPGYGNGARCLAEIAAIIKRGNVRTVLDYGCGRGALANVLRRLFPECIVDAYDPAMSGFSEIPLAKYDLVIANDVLEHLDPDNFGEELGEILALKPEWLFFNISCRPAVNLLPDGTNCHTLVRTPTWWKEELAARFPDHVAHDSQWIDANRSLAVVLTRKIDLRGKRVAIIGNGPSALTCSEAVDSYDVTVRFNHFQLGAGYEPCGIRTDIWCLHSGLVSHSTTKDSARGARMILVLDEPLSPKRRVLQRRRREGLARLNTLFPGKVVHDLGIVPQVKKQLPVSRRPTTGISGVGWVLDQQPGEVFLTGFSFEAVGPGHYFDASHAFNDVYHSRVAEFEWLAARAENPVFRFDEHITRKLSEQSRPAPAATPQPNDVANGGGSA